MEGPRVAEPKYKGAIHSTARAIAVGIVSVFAVLLAGCTPERDGGRVKVVMAADVSMSIEGAAEQESFDAIDQSLGRLRRGDSVVVIPITGDSWNDTQHVKVREHFSEKREPYDEDHRRFARRISQELKAAREAAMRHPASSTNILGAFDLCAEELSQPATGLTQAILALSDFIQDDSQYDFRTDRRLANSENARRLAMTLSDSMGRRFQGVKVYLGYLASVDGRQLTETRRKAVQAFWVTYLSRQGADVQFSIDGPGRLPEFATALLSKDGETTIPELPRLLSIGGRR
jgi:hypothetical protein